MLRSPVKSFYMGCISPLCEANETYQEEFNRKMRNRTLPAITDSVRTFVGQVGENVAFY